MLFDGNGNLVDSDGNPIPDAGGNGNGNGNLPFCNPLKVLINDGLGALGTVELDGTDQAIDDSRQATAFSDLETLTVQVAPGSPFLCNLIINDAETGELVADFNPADATYDAATGMAVFDLSAEGPFAPGRYDVRVANLYQADVYVAIPGDVNLDGTVDTVDRQIIEDNIEAGATTTGVWTTGDVNNDGVVDELDLEIVDGQLPLLGDINGDGFVTFGDLGPLLDIIFGAPTQVEADINGDGVVSFGDLGPLLDLVFSQ